MTVLPESPSTAATIVPIGTFSRPTYVAVAPGGADLLFVVEEHGRIRVLVNEVTQAAPFLSIANLVRAKPESDASGEEGMLSVAFAPDYPESGLFYVYFTNNDGDNEINEFKRSANALKADRSSRRVVLTIPHPMARNHNGGQMQFGPDGLLYISTGDGANGGGESARKLNSLLGKLLRIDPFGRTGSLGYRIPGSNPYVGKPGRDEIYAYGLRNPWRFSFDDFRIAIGDVGATQQEEVDFLRVGDARGANFGWPQFEGDRVNDDTRPGPDPAVFPMLVYDHDSGGCAVIGGYVVRDPDVPSLAGRYLYGDTCTGVVRSFVPRVVAQEADGDAATGIVLPGLTSFGRGFDGEIYLTQKSGAVSRLAPDAP